MTTDPKRIRDLTAISEHFESGGRGAEAISTGIVGHGQPDPGGKSYGLMQFTSKTTWVDKNNNVHTKIGGTVKAFVNAPECAAWKDEFKNLIPGSREFDDAWRRVATRDPAAFADEQRSFSVREYHEPQMKKVLEKTGLDLSQRSMTCNAQVFSTSIQHGPNTNLVVNAIKKLEQDEQKTVDQLTDGEIIKAITVQRAEHSQHALAPRFEREANFALDKLEKETGERFPRTSAHHDHPQTNHGPGHAEPGHPHHDNPAAQHAKTAPLPDAQAPDLQRGEKVSGVVIPPVELHATALSLTDLQIIPPIPGVTDAAQTMGQEAGKTVSSGNGGEDGRQVSKPDASGRDDDDDDPKSATKRSKRSRNRVGVADYTQGMRGE